MSRLLGFSYALIAYAMFNVWFLYSLGFLNEWLVPKHINSGAEPNNLLLASLANLGLISLFGVQHTIMARPWFKKWLAKFLPPELERSTFLIASAAIFALIIWLWQPMPTSIWKIDNLVISNIVKGISVAGGLLILYSTFLVDHWDLVGMRQALAFLRNQPMQSPVFKERSLYRWIRHPMMLGVLIWIWATPNLTYGHLLFSLTLTIYIFIGVSFEERGLLDELGEDYRNYRRRVPMMLPTGNSGQRSE